MKKVAEDINKAFQLISDTCYEIKDACGCDDCPMRYLCLESGDESVVQIADLTSKEIWQEFLEYKDKAKSNYESSIADDVFWDSLRQAEVDERAISDDR